MLALKTYAVIPKAESAEVNVWIPICIEQGITNWGIKFSANQHTTGRIDLSFNPDKALKRKEDLEKSKEDTRNKYTLISTP